ncbi:MAG: M15 family metallopeptidase [Candidatus Thiodiazotropha sp. 6PLUC2]
MNKTYLRIEIAVKLTKAQCALKVEYTGYLLQVLDTATPRSVSRAMYEKTKGSRFEKYVANPTTGSMHIYGIAVDITINDESGSKLDMGPSPFYSSHVTIYWNYFLKKIGFSVSKVQQKNLDIFKRVMLKAGFRPLAHEWWHFNGGFFKANLRSSTANGAALLVFYSNNLEGTLTKVTDAGGKVIKAIFTFPGGRRFHFTEPSGNEFAVWSDAGA